MNVLAIVASARKKMATDTLVDKSIEGIYSEKEDDINIKKINLFDYKIKFCRGCLACRDSKQESSYVDCVLDDDMLRIYEMLLESDAIIIGTPLHMGHVPGIVMTFLERICWIFAKPEGKVLTIDVCPLPRSEKKRESIIILTNSCIPPIYRIFCDTATKTIKGVMKDSLNAKTLGSLYAGDIESRGVHYYSDKAYRLGKKIIHK